MSQENVEIVRLALWETGQLGDFDLDDWLDEFFDPDIEWHDVPVLPDGVFTSAGRLPTPVGRLSGGLAENGHRHRAHGPSGDRVVCAVAMAAWDRQSGLM